eukprot:2939316-Rhodomonas_salina.2
MLPIGNREIAPWSRGWYYPALPPLRACYAMSGTDLAYTATPLRACYAMSVSDLAYAAMALRDVRH